MGAWTRALRSALSERLARTAGQWPREEGLSTTTAWTDDIADAARDLGYDGIVFRNIIDTPSAATEGARPTTVYGALKPDTFNPASDARNGGSAVPALMIGLPAGALTLREALQQRYGAEA